MLIDKEDSKKIEQEIEKIIASYTKEINDNSKYIQGVRVKAESGFIYIKLLAKHKENPTEFTQEDVNREFAKRMRVNDKKLNSNKIQEILQDAIIEGDPVSSKVGECAEKIKEEYKESGRLIYCVSTEKGLKKVNPKRKVSNYYIAGSLDIIVGTSSYDVLLEKIVEECAGENVKKAGKYIIYSQNPFNEGRESGEEIKLNREITIYAVNEENFAPVLNYRTNRNFDGIIDFRGEWISRSESEDVQDEKSIKSISKDFFNERQVFVQKSNIDVVRQIEDNDDEEEILNILEMLLEEGELEYLNPKYDVNINKRLLDAKKRNDERLDIAKKTMKAIDPKKIEEYLNQNIAFAEPTIQRIKQIAVEAEDLDAESEEKKDKGINDTKLGKEDICRTLSQIDSLLGIRTRVISYTNKREIEEILINGTEKDLVSFYTNKLLGNNRSEKEKAVLTDIVYYATKRNKEEIKKEKLQSIKEANQDLLDLIYFKENGISERSIYSFIIDCCDDDIDEYKKKISRLKSIVENDEIEDIKFAEERYFNFSNIVQQFETRPKELKRQIKDFFNKRGKMTLVELESKNKVNLNDNGRNNEKAIDSDLLNSTKIKPQANAHNKDTKRNEQKQRKKVDMDI